MTVPRDVGDHVLVVNFDFPPNAGIGGRRWGLLARAFADRGLTVSVIKSAPTSGNVPSPWTQEVMHERIRVTSLPRGYPSAMYESPPGLLGRATGFIARCHARIRFKGSLYDRSAGWEAVLAPALEEHVRDSGIRWIFATGAPWDLLRVVSQFRRSHPATRLWADCRDPWLDSHIYGMPNLTPYRLNQERDKARIVLSNADVLSAPAPEIFEGFQRHGIELPSTLRLFHLKHFYVSNAAAVVPTRKPSNEIRIVYGGEIYADTAAYLRQIATDLDRLKMINAKIYDRIRINIYSPSWSTAARFFAQHAGVTCAEPVGSSIASVIAQADWCMLLHAEHNRNFLTTKFYDYQPLGTPFLFVGPPGAVLDTVLAQNRGLAWPVFINHIERGNPPNSCEFFQRALPEDSVEHRVQEIFDQIGELS